MKYNKIFQHVCKKTKFGVSKKKQIVRNYSICLGKNKKTCKMLMARQGEGGGQKHQPEFPLLLLKLTYSIE